MTTPLHNKKVTINMQYEFTVYDEQLTEDDVLTLLENEPITEVLSLLDGNRISWRKRRVNSSVDIEDI